MWRLKAWRPGRPPRQHHGAATTLGPPSAANGGRRSTRNTRQGPPRRHAGGAAHALDDSTVEADQMELYIVLLHKLLIRENGERTALAAVWFQFLRYSTELLLVTVAGIGHSANDHVPNAAPINRVRFERQSTA